MSELLAYAAFKETRVMTTEDRVVRDLEFGVGSFTFETFPASEDNDNDWEDNVRYLLESIPTVRDVEIKV